MVARVGRMDASLPINDFEKNNLENPGASHRGQGNSAFRRHRSGSKRAPRRHTDRSPPKEQVRQRCLALPVSRLPLQASWRPFQLGSGTIGRASGRALSIWAHVLLRPWTFCPDSVAAVNQDRRIKRQDARAAIPSKAALRPAATSSSHSSATRQAPSADGRAALPRWVRCPSRGGPGSPDSRRRSRADG